MTRQRQTNLFLVGRDQDRCALIAETFADEYPDIRIWRFRCIVDAGGALLRCRPSALPDAVVLADRVDDWTRMRLRECVGARRELIAVPVFVFPEAGQADMPGVQWRTIPAPDTSESAEACVHLIAREAAGLPEPANVTYPVSQASAPISLALRR